MEKSEAQHEIDSDQHHAFQPIGLGVGDYATRYDHRQHNTYQLEAREVEIHVEAQKCPRDDQERGHERSQLRRRPQIDGQRQGHLILGGERRGIRELWYVTNHRKEEDTSENRCEPHRVGCRLYRSGQEVADDRQDTRHNSENPESYIAAPWRRRRFDRCLRQCFACFLQLRFNGRFAYRRPLGGYRIDYARNIDQE